MSQDEGHKNTATLHFTIKKSGYTDTEKMVILDKNEKSTIKIELEK